jgi:hypothetical protein
MWDDWRNMRGEVTEMLKLLLITYVLVPQNRYGK